MGSDQSVIELIVRRMDMTDLDSVMHVEHRANSHGWRRQTFIDCLAENHECWVVVEPYTSAYTIAHAILLVGVDSAELLNISVDPSQQGRGVGRLLLDHMLRRSRTKPIDSVFLEVRVSNKRAINLYESVGFKLVSRRKDYYRHDELGREDAFVLSLSLYTQPIVSAPNA